MYRASLSLAESFCFLDFVTTSPLSLLAVSPSLSLCSIYSPVKQVSTSVSHTDTR